MRKKNQVQDRERCLEHGSQQRTRCSRLLTPDRMLIGAWVFIGLIPYALMIRSYLNFVIPHKITETLVVPPGHLTELCPVEGYSLGQVWWNVQVTHYYNTRHGRLCHFVIPQYNIHGNHLIGSSKVEPYETTPSSCRDDSHPFEMYIYHGSLGYFSFYEEPIGTYCAEDRTAYIVSHGFGTYDINGPSLVEDTGSTSYRKSYWYATTGALWVVYRGLVLRRSFIICKRYARRCSNLGVSLRRKEAVVYVHEQLRLTAHGATKLHRVALLYLLIEGLMGDLFLLIANNGLLSKIQYVSLGYNLSGLLLVAFEIIESTNWLRERTRVFIKRLLFCYESSLLGEIVGAALQQSFLTRLNGSRALKKSNHVNLAVSHYVWSIVGHSIYVLSVIGFIMLIRSLWTIVYVWWKHRTWSVFTASCCVDTALGKRNKMTLLGGYHWYDGKLYYKPDALRSFGLLKMEGEDGSECLVLRKLHWFAVPRNDLFVIGTVSDDLVKPSNERLCTGIVRFWGQCLGGDVEEAGRRRGTLARSTSKQARVYCDDRGALPHVVTSQTRIFTAQRKLLLVWLLAGVAPFVLQMRSFLKFVTPHKLTKSLIVPSGSPEETRNLVEICPVRALILSGVWWNVEPTHYYLVGSKRICHFVAPQYNTHGNYLIGATKVEPYDTTPTNCADDSYAFDQYFYHGSIGYYSFYEEQTGTYCAKDNTVYIFGNGLGSFDINGSFLAEDTGSGGYRHSFYYGLVGSIWVTYRALVLRRSFISCKRYGRRCDEVGENLNRKEAVIFVQENLRLSAHGATIYHRFALLYLLVEGIMTDLFLLIANEVRLSGYNLSGFLLLIYEIIEATTVVQLRDSVSGGTAECSTPRADDHRFESISIFDKSKSTALAVSYYFWSLIGHGIFVLALTAFVLSVRTLWAVGYAWSRHQHHIWAIFTEPCSVDSILKLRNKMTSLGGYRYDNGKLFYRADTLKSFGLLKLEEKDGTEYSFAEAILAWDNEEQFICDRYHLRTKCGALRRAYCTSEVTFFDRRLGGSLDGSGSRRPLYIHSRMKKAQVHCDTKEFQHNVSRTVESDRYMTAQRTLLLAWVVAGVIPFILQLRSYLKFASPHKITQNLVVPYGLEKETESLGDVCPVEGMLLAGSWFNIEPTHYFTTDKADSAIL
ncbi:hypothetical protein GQ600_16409 [Phytophthora cactorum]|nr:hypothetical protein GQ600_16409 [Phytophthora cactorum]